MVGIVVRDVLFPFALGKFIEPEDSPSLSLTRSSGITIRYCTFFDHNEMFSVGFYTCANEYVYFCKNKMTHDRGIFNYFAC